MKSIEKHTKRKIKLIYIGKDKSISNTLNEIQDFEINFFCYDNPILAYHDLIKHQSNCDLIFCDAKIQGLNVNTFFEQISHLSAKKYLIGNEDLNQKKIQLLKTNKIDDVFASPLDSTALNQKFLFVFNDFKKIDSPILKKTKSSVLKRVFDVCLSFVSLTVLSPLFILVAIASKIDSKGPIFFTSKRVGQGYKVFNFYKFRTMKIGAELMLDQLKDLNQYQSNKTEELNLSCEKCESLGKACSEILLIDDAEICERFYHLTQQADNSSFLKFKNDPRVTKLGEFLRKTSIDELPQLFNILKGDMSFVGNRPLPIYEAEQLTSDDWVLRFMAPAGLTGLWQVRKRGQAEMSEEERKRLDNSYARNRSFFKDILLIFQTFPALTQKENV